MILDKIIKGTDIKSITGHADTEVAGVAYDSREVLPGYLFVAVRGENVDGHNFIEDAVGRGAVAVVCEEEPAGKAVEVPVVGVKDSRAALAAISNNFFGRPSESLYVIGVTGTNGKTTTTYLI
ncbi:MAG TPA: Mur ligase domain-containing protein, partial [Candidatus Sulfobium mesophilum]|nr:Mur ligase domain-containing protein [Candidatus Sulfobium mesophilum]